MTATIVGDLDVDVRWSDGQYVASHEPSGFYGEGDSPSEAIDDFRASVGDLYRYLVARQGRLSTHMRRQFEYAKAAVA